MANRVQREMAQSVPVVEADVLDRMNETRELIAQRAYEIYESRGSGHGSDQDDWFTAEGQLLPKIDIDYDVTDNAVVLTARVPGFDAEELEVEVGRRRAVVCGVHPGSSQGANGHSRDKKVMRIVELPVDVNPAMAKATIEGGTLQVMLPRLL